MKFLFNLCCCFRSPKKVTFALNEKDLKNANITKLNINKHDFTKNTNMCTWHYVCLNKDQTNFLLLKFDKKVTQNTLTFSLTFCSSNQRHNQNEQALKMSLIDKLEDKIFSSYKTYIIVYKKLETNVSSFLSQYFSPHSSPLQAMPGECTPLIVNHHV